MGIRFSEALVVPFYFAMKTRRSSAEVIAKRVMVFKPESSYAYSLPISI